MNYFAYGSNLSSARFKARLPNSEFITIARLNGFKLCFHKVSEDGSGKCDVSKSADPKDLVYGVVYSISEADRQILDAIEGVGMGYEIANLAVVTADGHEMGVFTYQATMVDPDKRPYAWYHAFVMAGAREHGFPANYLADLESIVPIPDPDHTRNKLNRQILGGIPSSD